MAKKIHVEKDSVKLDEVTYIVSTAGASQYVVTDEFGEKLGYFTVRGRAIVPEDYRNPGAPPIIDIARPWVTHNLAKEDEKPAAPVSKGVCQLSTTAAASDADLQAARSHRAWLKKQPGMKASYLVRDPATGKATTIAIWQSRAHLDAAASAAGAEGAALKSDNVEIYPFVEEP